MMSIKNSRLFLKKAFQNKKGFTLIEVILAIAILSIVISAVFPAIISVNKAYTAGNERSNIQQNVRFAANFITQEIRFASSVSILSEIPSSFDYTKRYIYVKNGSIVQNVNGVEKAVFPVNTGNLKCTLNFTGNNKTLEYSLSAVGSGKPYSLDSEVIVLNLGNSTIQGSGSGSVVCYSSK